MEQIVYLRDLVFILAASVIVVAVLSRVRIPSIAGFILAGILIGPGALGLIDDIHQVELLAEIGVALLLFGIGLELSLDRLRRLWWPIIIGGLLQMTLTGGAAFTIASLTGLAWKTSLLIGLLVAVSSTAIVLRGLELRGELDAPHGRLTLGILVFQDLSVVPILMMIPILAGNQSSPQDIVFTLGRAGVIIAGVLVAARYIIPPALNFIAATRQRNLFVSAILLLCLGIAWIISSLGVSLALGAFLAGLVVAGSEYRHQALADIIPFKDIFTGFFFVSVGMLVSPQGFLENMPLTLGLLAAIFFGKALIVMIVGLLMSLPLRVSILAGVGLAQVGEFSFIMARAAQGSALLPPTLEGSLFSAIVLSMLITPFAILAGPHMAAGVGRIAFINRFLRVATAEDATAESSQMHDHVIIGGFGFAGQRLAQALASCGLPYLVVELNVETIRLAKKRGERVYFGDITSAEVLEKLGIASARELVLVINDPNAIERTVRLARSLAPGLHIAVRVNYLLDIERLRNAGADDVISAELESAGEIVSRILKRCDIDKGKSENFRQSLRQEARPGD